MRLDILFKGQAGCIYLLYLCFNLGNLRFGIHIGKREICLTWDKGYAGHKLYIFRLRKISGDIL